MNLAGGSKAEIIHYRSQKFARISKSVKNANFRRSEPIKRTRMIR